VRSENWEKDFSSHFDEKRVHKSTKIMFLVKRRWRDEWYKLQGREKKEKNGQNDIMTEKEGRDI
jgi:hypothetical protein